VKLNHGFSGEGNAVFSFAGCPDDEQARWIAAHLPLNLSIEARDLRWERYSAKLAEQGGIVEAWVTGTGLRSPSVQMRITPLGGLEFISTHDQILGGPSGQIFQACTFPADAAYALEIQSLAARVGAVLKVQRSARPLRRGLRVGSARAGLAALCDRDQPAQGRHDPYVPAAAVPDAGPLRRGPRAVRDAIGTSSAAITRPTTW
jgi:hypothetical protein